MARTRLSASALIALTIGMTLGNVGGNVMPVLLDGFSARFQLSSSVAGAVAAAQLLATAAVALAFSGRAARPGRVRMARIGLVVAAVGFLGAWASPSVWVLLPANVVVGAGLGVVFAAASAALSSTPDVDRATTLTVLCSTIAIAVLILAIPLANDIGGGTAGFAVLAACCLLGIVLVRGLPEIAVSAHDIAGPALQWGFLLGVIVFGITEQGAWSYASVLGQKDAGLTDASAALVLGIAAVAALAGVPLAALARRICGARGAMAGTITLGAAAKVTVVLAQSSTVFGVACVVWQICYLATLVLVLAAAGTVDPSGRWVAASAGALALGTGIGPAVIGVTLDRLGLAGVAIGIALAVAGAAVPILRVAPVRRPH